MDSRNRERKLDAVRAGGRVLESWVVFCVQVAGLSERFHAKTSKGVRRTATMSKRPWTEEEGMTDTGARQARRQMELVWGTPGRVTATDSELMKLLDRARSRVLE